MTKKKLINEAEYDLFGRMLELYIVDTELDEKLSAVGGKLIGTLIKAVTDYDKKHYPIAPPSPEEAAKFRAEQEQEP